ncbi:MAG TPA: hypothetical protein VK590_10775, partial [Saprospiraceae bacterium]|nr:hypothetical protein [Saprospiraceae bacterium]
LGIPRGIFYASLDIASAEIKSKNYKEFPKETYTAGMKGSKGEKALKKIEEGKKVGYTFEIRDLIPRADGGSTMIAEEYDMQIHTSSRGPGMGIGAVSITSSSSTWEYTYKNIIIAKISESGTFDWITVIPKFQVTTSNHEWRTNTPASFLLFDHKNDSYSIFFNDHKENLIPSKKAEGIQKVVNQKQSVLVNMKVDALGNVSKKTEAVKLPKDDEKTHFYPVLSFMPLGEKDIILYGTESSHDKFARIHFDN